MGFQTNHYLWVLLSGLYLATFLGPIQGMELISRQEALARTYPEAEIRSKRVFLTDEEKSLAGKISGVQIPTALVARYEAWVQNKLVGKAYVDTHRVRTKKESLLICLNGDGSVRRIEVTAFLEPPEYQASAAWYAQYQDRVLNNEVQLNRSIRPVAGATLTAVAANEAVRRVLAIDQVLGRRE